MNRAKLLRGEQAPCDVFNQLCYFVIGCLGDGLMPKVPLLSGRFARVTELVKRLDRFVR